MTIMLILTEPITRSLVKAEPREDGGYYLETAPGYALNPLPLKDGTYVLPEEVLLDPAHAEVHAELATYPKRDVSVEEYWISGLVITSLSPANNAIDIDANTNLVVTFNFPISFGTGSLHVYDAADQLVVSLTGFGQVGQGGTLTIEDNKLTADLTADFKQAGRFYALMDETLLNLFIGISDKTVWTWTVAPAVTRKGKAVAARTRRKR